MGKTFKRNKSQYEDEFDDSPPHYKKKFKLVWDHKRVPETHPLLAIFHHEKQFVTEEQALQALADWKKKRNSGYPPNDGNWSVELVQF